jgi:phospholipase C
LIKETYEAIRNSAFWPNSLLMITWDEHGGFYDHAIPPPAVAPGDTLPGSKYNQFHFTFEQYGPRVPGIVISPLIPKNLIDHRLYDHASILATLESLLGLRSLTARDGAANRLDSLLTLSTPRDDAPATLPSPANADGSAGLMTAAAPATLAAAANSRALETVNAGNLPAVLNSALRQEIQTSPPDQKQAIIYRFRKIQTRAQARQYLDSMREKVTGI